MAHMVENMVSLRKMPWHGLGTVVSEELTLTEALQKSGMDYEVEKVPLFGPDDQEVEGVYGLRRSDTLGIIGTCKDRYKIFQNAKGFEFMSSLRRDGDITWETAGVLDGGRTVWILARLGRPQTVAGDAIEPYVLFYNHAANNGVAGVKNSQTRVVCANTLAISMRESQSAGSHLRIPHVGDLTARLNAARVALGLISEQQETMIEFGKATSRIALTDEMLGKFMESILPMPEAPGADELAPLSQEERASAEATLERRVTRAKNRRESLESLLWSPTNQTEASKGTLWGAYNAAVEWADHESTRAQKTTAAQHVWFGNAEAMKTDIFEAAAALI